MVPDVTLIPIDGLPEIKPGDDLAAMIIECLRAAGRTFEDGDVLAIAQKVVSKSEGRIRKLADVVPGPEAERMAAESGKDAHFRRPISRPSLFSAGLKSASQRPPGRSCSA